MTIAEQKNKLKMQEIAQANLNTKYSALLCEQIQLKAELEGKKMMLSNVQKEKREMETLYENLHAMVATMNQDGVALQSKSDTDTVKVDLIKLIFQICKDNCAKLEQTNAVLQTVVSEMKNPVSLPVKNGGDGPSQTTALEPTVQAIDSVTVCPVSESEKQRSITVGGLGQNIQHSKEQYFGAVFLAMWHTQQGDYGHK